MILYHTRLHHLEGIEGRINSSPRIENSEGVVVSGFKVDPEARLLTVEWDGRRGSGYDEDDEDEEMQGVDGKENRRIAVIAITEEGCISGCVVKAKGKRVRNMERQITGDGGGGGDGGSGRSKKMLAQVLGEDDKYDMPIRNLAERLMWNGNGAAGLDDDAGDVTM